MKTQDGKTVYLLFIVLLFCLIPMNLTMAQELVGWWGLDDGTGTKSIDLSGKGNNGTVQGKGKWTGGKLGGAMRFNGSDAFISAPHIPLDNRSFTIMMWVNPTVLTGNHTIFSQGSGAIEVPSNTLLHIRLGGPDAQYGTPNYGVRFSFYGSDLDTPPNIIKLNIWYHVACVYDYENKTRIIYIDGVKKALDTGVEPYTSATGDTLFGRQNGFAQLNQYNGILDDIRIYDGVLTEEEINEIASSGSNTTIHSIFNTIEEAEKLIQDKKAKQAVPLLDKEISSIEKEISKYEQFKQKSPDKDTSVHEVMVCELYYLQALASEAKGESKKNIAENYKKTLLSNALFDENFTQMQGAALLWLFKNMNSDYSNTVNSLLNKNSYFIKSVSAKSGNMISKKQTQAAIVFLESNIALYQQWQKEHPFNEVIAEDMLPEIYFQLAEAKEAINAPAKEIAEAYSNTFNFSSYDYIPERTASLIWLAENNRIEELTKVIKSFTTEQDIQQSSKDIIVGACKHFESEKKENGPESLFRTLFSTAKYPAEWGVLVESCITNKTSPMAKVYYSYLEGTQKLKFGVDCKLAERLVSEEKYKEASELYKDILARCGSDDNKSEIHFCLIKSLFDGDLYNEAITQIEEFISNNYKGTIRSRTKESMLMKGRALIQLGEVDKAIDVFSAVMIEYPETGELSETTFFIGYCYMLQAKFKEAIEAFEIVCRSYPNSTYADQAEELLDRIKEMGVDSD